MHDNIRLGYIGLSDHEVRIMKSIFTLSPDLQERCILTGVRELEKADLILGNVDHSDSIIQWNKIARVNKLATSMTLSNKGKFIDRIVPLTLPIRLQKLMEALENVVNDRTKIMIPEGPA